MSFQDVSSKTCPDIEISDIFKNVLENLRQSYCAGTDNTCFTSAVKSSDCRVRRKGAKEIKTCSEKLENDIGFC